MNPYVIHDLATVRQREAHRLGASARLAALARCCNPSELSRLIARLRSTLEGGAVRC
jgi:hypothetical protein